MRCVFPYDLGTAGGRCSIVGGIGRNADYAPDQAGSQEFGSAGRAEASPPEWNTILGEVFTRVEGKPMAVREALLALLLPGPAYGFQLHGALATRTGGRRRVNVGQSYATLDRATKAGLIEPAGTTDDGLPLHRLTEAGTAVARGWLEGADASGTDPWDETIDRVLIAASLPGVDERPIIAAERARWAVRQAPADAEAGGGADEPSATSSAAAGLARLAGAAETARARAAIDWLDAAALAAASPASLSFAPTAERPRRGRRPAAASSANGPAQPSAIA